MILDEFSDNIAVLDITLWIICIIITSIIIAYTSIKYVSKNKEWERYQKENIITWIIFFSGINFSNIINLIWRYIIEDSQIDAILDSIGFMVLYAGIFVKILNIERGINRSGFYKGHYFSILFAIIIIFVIIVNPLTIKEVSPVQTFFLVLLLVGYMIFPGIFLYLGIKSTGSARINALMIFIGAFIIGAGLAGVPQNMEALLVGIPDFELWTTFYTILSPTFIIIGMSLIVIGYKGTL